MWHMVLFILLPLYQFILRYWLTDKERELVLLRQQLLLLKRRRTENRVIPSIFERLLMTMTGSTIADISRSLVIFKPETLIRWHRELVNRKWSFPHKRLFPGRKPLSRETTDLVIRLARENRRWGYGKIQGELLKLGIRLSESSILRILRNHGLTPINRKGPTWKEFIGQYRDCIMACDFFTVETIGLKTLYVLFFIHLSTRRIYMTAGSQFPGSNWVCQQARNLTDDIHESGTPIRFLLRDRDSKFSPAFDTIFASENITGIKTPYRTPVANSIAERWIRSIREECLDHVIILNEQHLRYVLRQYLHYYNHCRPHQGLSQMIPAAGPAPPGSGIIKHRDYLGGLLKDYYREQAA